MALNRYVVRVDPQGQAVTVDVLDTSGTSVPTFESSQFGAAPRSLPLVITSPTDFWLQSPGPYDVSCKVGGSEVADAGSPKRVQVSDVPTLVVPDWERQRTAASGGSSALPRPDARSAVAATVALGNLPGAYPGEVHLTFTLAGSVVGSTGDEDDRFATGDSGNALMVPADAWVQVFIRDLEVSSPGAVPRLRMNTEGLFSDQCLHPLEIGADLYRFDGVLWDGFPTAWASDPTTGLYLILADVGEGVALSGNLYVYFNTFSPAA